MHLLYCLWRCTCAVVQGEVWAGGSLRSPHRQHVISRRLRVLPTCPEWLRLSPGLPSPAKAGLWQLTQGWRYGSHHARSLETSWWIGNKNCQILRRTHSKLCYMYESYKNRMDAVKFHSSHSAELSPTGPKLWEIILRSWQAELSKSETSKFRSNLGFYRKLCACNLPTWGLNVVLRYKEFRLLCCWNFMGQ